MDLKLISSIILVAVIVNQVHGWGDSWSFGWGSNIEEEVKRNMENVQKNIAAVQQKIENDIRSAQPDVSHFTSGDDGSTGHIISQSSSYSSSVDGNGNKLEKRITHIIRQTADGKIFEETITS